MKKRTDKHGMEKWADERVGSSVASFQAQLRDVRKVRSDVCIYEA